MLPAASTCTVFDLLTKLHLVKSSPLPLPLHLSAALNNDHYDCRKLLHVGFSLILLYYLSFPLSSVFCQLPESNSVHLRVWCRSLMLMFSSSDLLAVHLIQFTYVLFQCLLISFCFNLHFPQFLTAHFGLSKSLLSF